MVTMKYKCIIVNFVFKKIKCVVYKEASDKQQFKTKNIVDIVEKK